MIYCLLYLAPDIWFSYVITMQYHGGIFFRSRTSIWIKAQPFRWGLAQTARLRISYPCSRPQRRRYITSRRFFHKKRGSRVRQVGCDWAIKYGYFARRRISVSTAYRSLVTKGFVSCLISRDGEPTRLTVIFFFLRIRRARSQTILPVIDGGLRPKACRLSPFLPRLGRVCIPSREHGNERNGTRPLVVIRSVSI